MNSNFFLIIVIRNLLINFTKFFLYFIQLIILKLFFHSYSKKKISENIFLSHSFGQPHFEDNYFGKIKISLKKLKLQKKFNSYYLNHSSFFDFSFNKNILSGLNLSYFEIIKLFFLLIKIFFFVLIKIFFEKNKLVRKLLIYLLGNIISKSSFKTFLTMDEFILALSTHRTKKVFFTFEGHIYEKYLIAKLKNKRNKIKTFGYFHTGITDGLNSFIINNLKQFLPSTILCINPKNTIFFKKVFGLRKVYNIGKILPISNNKVMNWKFLSSKKKIVECLVLYENNFNQIKKLLNDSFLYKNKFKFTIRSHPEFLKNLQQKHMHTYLHSNLKISKNSKLEKDLENKHLIIYNSSSVLIDSILRGIFPFQLRPVLHDTYSFFGTKNKFLITDLNELFTKINLIKSVNYVKILDKVKKNFSEINAPFLIKLINE